MLYYNEILPNIWWIYTDNNTELTIDEQQFLNKFTSHHKINSCIKIDKYCNFWNRSNQFIFDIKKQIEKHEEDSLKKLCINISKIMMNNYINSTKTLVYSNKYNDLCLIIWVYLFKAYADIPYINIIDSLVLKLKTTIVIGEKEKRFIKLFLS